MSKIALRVYNREIESLIDQGHVDEAVSHCQHILKTFPKTLETYRMLGKAYLEGRQYTDAADIFQRVLLAVPDDFISHLGMSIICDEQKDLDTAIWHMERAFESNPSNGGVQGELRRLYGRRDGMEPPKIRLTRGALAQMYTKGDQYQQAIAEIKSVLAEDSSRTDMKVLMARAYYRGGQKVEATEICTELLRQYPFSFDANRILVDLLPGTSMAQNLDTYRKRVQSLDPYAAFATGSIFDTDGVPDNAVSIDRYEWDVEPDSQANYPALGQPQPASQEAIPDFLRSSGWGPSTGEFQDGPLNFNEPEPSAPATGGELAAADIPDWLKAMAPPQSASQRSGQEAPSAEEENLVPPDLDWLAGLGGPVSAGQPSVAETSPSSAASSGGQPDWLSGLGADSTTGATESAAGPAAGEDLDWLAGLGAPVSASKPPAAEPSPASVAPSSGQPDWMSDSGTDSTTGAAESAVEPAAGEDLDWLAGLGSQPPTAPVDERQAAGTIPDNQPPAPASDQSDWMKDFSVETATGAPVAGEDLDWLAGLGGLASGAQAPVEPPPAPSTTPSEDETDWLKGFGIAASAGVAASAADAGMDGLGNLGAPQEEIPSQSAPSEFVPSVSQPPAEIQPETNAYLPDWLKSVSDSQKEIPAQPVEPLSDVSFEAPSFETTPPQTESVSPVESEALPDWLSDMAAPKAESQTQPEPTADWMKDLSGDEFAQPLSEPASGAETAELKQDESLGWLDGLTEKQDAKADEFITNPVESVKGIPDWASKVEEIPAVPMTPPAPVEKPRPVAQDDPNYVPPPLSELVSGPGTSEAEQDDAMKWLEMLAAKQGAKSEELITNPDERTEKAPGWVDQVGIEPAAAAQPVAEIPAVPVTPPAPAEKPRPVAQDDPNFVPPPLSELVSGPGTSEAEQDDAMKWLEMLAAKQGAKSEELITNPEERTENAPGWVGQVGIEPAAPAQPVAEIPAAPVTPPTPVEKPRPVAQDDPNYVPPPLSELVSGPGTSEAEQDDAMKWLEMLAAKQGAKSEELITNPEERTENAPGWVGQVGIEPAAPAQPVAEIPAAPVTPPTPVEKPRPVAQDDPNYVPPPLSELVSGPGTSEAEQDDAMKWLEMLAAKQGAKSEELITNPEERTENAPGWVGQVEIESEQQAIPSAEAPQAVEPVTAGQDETMDWLQGLAAEPTLESQPAEPAVVEQAPAEPDWLTDFGSAAATAGVADEGLDWLGSLSLPESHEPAAAVPEEQPESEQPSKVMPWDTQPIHGLWEEETPAVPAQPVEAASWEQVEAPAYPVEQVPWEPEAAPAEVESQASGDISEWLKSLDEQEQPAQKAPDAEMPSPVEAESIAVPADEFPAWLKDMNAPQQGEQEQLPDWLKDQSADEQPPEPISVPEWVTAETVPTPPPAVTESPVAETPVIETATQAPAESVVQESAPAQKVVSQPVSPVSPPPSISPALRQTGMLGGKDALTLHRSRDLLAHSSLDSAMKEYVVLIKRGKMLEEIIYDLKEATYSHPVDVIVWQTLGDAYMRANQLQEALDAYTKAEELLR